jgi:hypothetical protein
LRVSGTFTPRHSRASLPDASITKVLHSRAFANRYYDILRLLFGRDRGRNREQIANVQAEGA